MRSGGSGDLGRPSRPGRRDLAYRLLAAAVSGMRPGRRDWGQAMLAELDQIRSPSERVWFAFGAARVAAFPPRAARPWWAVPAGLAVRAAVAAAAIHALVPAAGLGPAVLAALPAAGAWAMLTMPSLARRQGGPVSAAQIAVTAGIMTCLVLALTTVQRYPQVISTGTDGGWVIGLVFDAASAGYLAMAWSLARRPAGARRNSLYALAAGLVAVIAAAHYIARPSLTGLWAGPLPGVTEHIVVCLALPSAAALASSHRGRLQDGLETAGWATLLAGSIMPIMIIAATYRVASSAAGSPQIVADAHLHGVASAPVWLASDNLSGAIISLIWMPAVFFALAAGGAALGCAVRAAARHGH